MCPWVRHCSGATGSEVGAHPPPTWECVGGWCRCVSPAMRAGPEEQLHDTAGGGQQRALCAPYQHSAASPLFFSLSDLPTCSTQPAGDSCGKKSYTNTKPGDGPWPQTRPDRWGRETERSPKDPEHDHVPPKARKPCTALALYLKAEHAPGMAAAGLAGEPCLPRTVLAF